jgi:ABC-type maltose transport system permease subunit
MNSEISLDLRLPIGILFLVIGALLALYGFLAEGVAIDRWWGLVMVAFGGMMFWLARRARAA